MSEHWQDVERTLDDLASYAQSQPNPTDYHQRLLDATIQLSEAQAGAVWLCDRGGTLQRASQHQQQLLDSAFATHQHQQWLIETLRTGKVQTATASSDSSDDPHASSVNGSTPCLTFCSIRADQAPVGVVELLHGGGDLSDTERVEQLLVAITELAGEYHQQSQMDDLRETVQTSDALHAFALSIQKRLDPESTAFAIANDARALLQCDRVSLLSVRHNRCVLTAVSGVERANVRADTAAGLQALANAVRHSDQPIWYGDIEPPADLAETLDDYADHSHARRLALLPLRYASDPDQPTEVCGVLALEQMEGEWPEGTRSKADMIAQHSAAALYRAQDYGSLPLLSISKALRRLTWLFGPESRPRATVVAAVFAAIMLALFLLPAELKIKAHGHTQPALRARIFAPYDADVESVFVIDGKTVEEGDPLVTLRSLSLEAELEEVLAKLEAGAARLVVIDIETVTADQDADTKMRQAQLAAERKEVEALQVIHEKRRDEIRSKLAKLKITSPMKGKVLSWMLESALANRPVTRGQHLLTVGDVTGKWTLELEVNDFHTRHLRNAPSPTTVDFAMESAPNRLMHGVLQHIEPSASMNAAQRNVVRVLVEINEPHFDLRPGAKAVAHIRCGQTSLGYAWFHDLIDTTRQWLWW